jgi:hypothetical protein
VSFQLYYRPSFQRSLKRLGHEQKVIAGLILESLDAYYSNGCNLIAAQEISPRFFYKQLIKPYYEAGVEGNIRIVLMHEDDKAIAILAGNH